MSILLVTSNRCPHCKELVNMIGENSQIRSVIASHVIEINGLPNKNMQIERVPTIITASGKRFVGQECIKWIESLLPVDEIEYHDMGCLQGASLNDNEENGGSLFSLNDYGQSLQPPMTKELQDKISKKVDSN